ncbi:GAF domain-containing hybrid sensor histidine kinase/response regulator [Desulfosediminicola ganghwensis]|uniref:GAF domain-containing hybrid sensor histidine kinase/response regulator n=1 Tax=Desulfosediminicola ganghwensis TaxID=2569540 RepID=UPI0010ABDBB4|nr:response regulator [Desulfosediminicola ganghwensis]
MPRHLFAAAPIASATFLELIQELTIGQRTADTPVRLHNFLHKRIFPKIGNFAIQLYLISENSTRDLKPPANAATTLRSRIPSSIALDEERFLEPFSTRSPTIIQAEEQPEWLRQTGNSTHIVTPIFDQNTIVGTLYIGSAEACTFSAEQLTGLMTLCSVIGSRLKSMDTIRQLKFSMQALERSEQIRSVLFQISEQSHNFNSLPQLYQQIHSTISTLVHAVNFSIMTWYEKDGKLYYSFPYVSDTQFPYHSCQRVEYDPGQKELYSLLFSHPDPLLITPENIEELIDTHGLHLTGPRPVSWLGVPFRRGNISGALILRCFTDIVYSGHDMRFMSFVARYIGDALARKQQIKQLHKAKEKAEQAEQKKSAFLATMSHEIRTPMNGIIGMTEIALDKPLENDVRTYLGMVKTSANRLLSLINDILDFSKIEAGKLDLVTFPFDIHKEITETLELLKIGIEKKHVHLDFTWDETIPKIVIGDATRLCQVITNLISNSIKFTDYGQVLLSVARTQKHTPGSQQLELQFKVRDTGVGIPSDKLNHVFRPFSQVGTRLDCNKRGTGLGLVIVAELVEKMGGTIQVASTPGRETTFHFSAEFRLPASPVLSLIPHNQTSSTDPKLRDSLKVLLAEDEPINRTVATTVLERAGWQVTSAKDGQEAVEMIRDHKKDFDLILMDIQMPRMDGFQATRCIRELERISGNHVPVIAMTAYAVKGDRKRCLEAGMDGYISKPIKPDRFYYEIESILLPLRKKTVPLVA